MRTVLDLKKLYEEDEHLWLFENAKLLREGRLYLADIEHIAETLEEMGKRDFREIVGSLPLSHFPEEPPFTFEQVVDDRDLLK